MRPFGARGPNSARTTRRLKRKEPSPRDAWRLDEVVTTINGEKRWLWRTVDQDGYVVDGIVGLHLIVRFGRIPRIHCTKS